MNPLEFKIRGNLNGIRFPCVCDVKYDGILVKAEYHMGDPHIYLENKSGKVYRLQAQILRDIRWETQRIEFLAELIYGDGKNGTLYQALSSVAINGLPCCSIRIFDILSVDGKSLETLPLVDRRQCLVEGIKPKYLVDSRVLDNVGQVVITAQNAIEMQWEGIVVKNTNETLQNQRWVKIKTTDTIKLEVTKVEPTRFEVKHGGVTVGIRKIVDVNVGDRVWIKHNGVQPEGSLRNPVHVSK